MPLIRYFLYMGGVLLAVLLLVGGYMGGPVSEVAQSGAEPTVARIRSAQKWPEKIVFDTSAPQVRAPDVAADVAAAALAAPPPAATPAAQATARQAYAMAAPPAAAAKPAAPAASHRRVAERHHRHPPQRVAARGQMMFFPMAMGW
jgi:predicted lipid-binding transport protein (Tim44 family)